MAESKMDIMNRSNVFLLTKAEKHSISCVDKDDKTISCVFFVNPMKGCGKVGKMCLIYGENIDIMVVTSGFCLVFGQERIAGTGDHAQARVLARLTQHKQNEDGA